MPITNPRTWGDLILEARTLLQDKLPTSGSALRYSDDEMFESINGFMTEVRTKRPDLLLPFGIRQPLPRYAAAVDMTTPFPLDLSVYDAFIYYLVGRAEIREDTWANDGRAVTLLNKAVSQLLSIQS